MDRRSSFILGILAGLSLSLSLVPSRSHADDTEIYVGGGAGVKPNILLIIDTSSSMLISAPVAYDPNVIYDGPCPTTHNGKPIVYMKYGASVPPTDLNCTTYFKEGTAEAPLDYNYWFYKDALRCDAAVQQLDNAGQWSGHVAASGAFGWTVVYRGYHTRLIECAADAGVHGEGDSDGDGVDENPERVYARKGSGITEKWTDDPAYQQDFHTSTADPYYADYRRFFFDANYVNYVRGGHSMTNRITIMKEVLNDLIDETDDARIALMRFDVGDYNGADGEGGMVIAPFVDAADPANKTKLKQIVDDIYVADIPSGTQLHETMTEAARYFSHQMVTTGSTSQVFANPSVNPPTAANYVSSPSVPGSRNGLNYDTGMTGCEENFIIYLTDGAATADSGQTSYTRTLYKDKTKTLTLCSAGSNGENDQSSESCLDELAFLLHNYDVNPGLAGEQTVRTFTVGFFVDNELLATTADKGGGRYYIANSHAQLKDAIKDAMSTIKVLAVNSSFTIPAVTVNSFNRVSHLDDLFFSLFKPGEARHWAGNLKKFRLKKNAAGEVEIVDRNGMPAVEPLAGFFKDDITSFWTTSGPDGGETEKGGAAERLGQLSERKIYTWIGPDLALTATSNQLGSTNSAITDAMVGAATTLDRTKILKWAQGVDIKDEDGDGLFSDRRPTMGDPLHAAPVTVMYGTKADPEGKGTIPDYTVYTATNDGYLHAFDGNDGNELFAFVPPELLGNLGEAFYDKTGDKLYGLDGFVVPLVQHDPNGNITGTKSYAHLVIGMRRGGNNYYALDVTNRNTPRLLWRIKGGEGNFQYLAQSWAEPVPTKVKIGSGTRNVLVISGGYDADQDDHDTDYASDNTGTAIYMVDAATGNRLWWAGPVGSGADLEVDAFRNSMPATVTVLDMNNDGYADRWYVPDTGGRIFRFDIANGNSAATLVRGGKIATLGAGDIAAPAAADTRKFFYPIDVSHHNDGDGQWLNLAIGSGNRTAPLDTTVQDRFFVLRDEHVYTVPGNYAAEYDIGIEDLFDATASIVDDTVMASNQQHGWYINLADEGEKVLAESVTYDGKLVFTSFSPSDGSNASCEADLGKGRVYAIDINSAKAVRNFDIIQEDSEEVFTVEDRSTELERSGIPPAMTIVFAEDNEGRPIGLVGPETVDVDLGDNVVQTYWYRSSQ